MTCMIHFFIILGRISRKQLNESYLFNNFQKKEVRHLFCRGFAKEATSRGSIWSYRSPKYLKNFKTIVNICNMSDLPLKSSDLDEESHSCPNADVSACEYCKLLNNLAILNRSFTLR